jgi:hypothetical protein
MIAAVALLLAIVSAGRAQTPPTEAETDRYVGLHKAAANDDSREAARLVLASENIDGRDGNGRTPLIVAAFRRSYEAAQVLIVFGADLGALDSQSYDALTIAAVQNDLDMVTLLLSGGASAQLVTSPYKGTALIAAAHLGHAEVCRALIKAKAPVDHVNSLGWTALIEAIVLGDGGPRHQATVAALIEGKARLDLADRNGKTPLALAREKGFKDIIVLLEAAGAK